MTTDERREHARRELRALTKIGALLEDLDDDEQRARILAYHHARQRFRLGLADPVAEAIERMTEILQSALVGHPNDPDVRAIAVSVQGPVHLESPK